MSNKWPIISIGEVAQIFDGPHATPQTINSGPIFLGIGALENGRLNLNETRHVTPEDFIKWTRRVKPQANDVVFSYETRIGQAAIIPENFECCLGRRMGLVRVNEKLLHPRFFLYFYLSPQFQVFLRSKTIHGATVDRLALTEFPSFPIALPPLAEQRAIAHILGSLDDKIELNRQMNETLEAMARALFKDWFVDFGPVRAKMEGRQPPGLAADIAALFPDALDDEGKPTGWEYRPLDEVIAFNPSEKLSKGETAPYLDMAALPTVGSWPQSPFLRAFSSGMRFRNNDTLLARITPCLENGKAAFIQCLNADQVAWGSTEFIVMRPKKNFSPIYGYILARNTSFREYAIKGMTGSSGRQRVSADILAKYPITVPPEPIWIAFGDMVESWFKLIKIHSEENQTLASLRDLLLPKLLSGELRVKEAETLVEEALE